MSREIKFRVWDYVISDWHATKAITAFDDRCNKGYNFNIVGFGNPKRTDIEQYTGLKDKNGKEIYEGDIVGVYNYYYNDETGKDEPGELEPWGAIVYEAPTFGLWGEPIYGSEDKHFYEVSNNMVVIGNIHENPELLGGEK